MQHQALQPKTPFRLPAVSEQMLPALILLQRLVLPLWKSKAFALLFPLLSSQQLGTSGILLSLW